MNLDFTSDQEMLRNTAMKLFAGKCPYSRVKELEDSKVGYSPELWRQMGNLGWQSLLLPEEYGGFGGQVVDVVIICEQIGRAAYPSPFLSSMQSGLIILEGGSEEQKKDLLPQIADGSLIVALAQYEAEASYFESGILMKAQPQGEEYCLDGIKMFVMDANVAGKLIVAARAGDAGITLFLVNADHPGITRTKLPSIGMDNTCKVTFNNVRASRKDVIGPVGEGWAILDRVSPIVTVARCAEMIGGCKASIDITAAYAKEREQYGKHIGSYQAIQHYMANMLLAYDTGFNYLYKVASKLDEGKCTATEVSVLKAHVNEAYKFISERAVQIHGAIGTTREADIGLFFRRAKAFEFSMGDTEFHNDRIAEALLSEGVPTI